MFEKVTTNLYIGSFLALLTSYTDLFGILTLFMIFDFISGYAKGFVNNNLNSSRGAIGICKKSLILLICVMSHYLSYLSGYDGIELMILYFFIANECLSVLENASKCGLPIPNRLRKALEQLKGDD